MQLSTFFVTVLATAVLASPSKRNYGGGEGGTPTPYDACSGLYDSLQCCATDVLGVADLDCGTPDGVPTSPASFEKICAAGGQRARCCVLPVLGQDVLCQTPLGL
ncbi:fungal hydrophobin [Hypoxylon rubiginosum]|uniref:Fungal hydrophobin n=1 Tax=Hypoxylon rubiginosum TaxID=110542 RepID=A0ACB9Z665_9PEZI|nr:fungal hydrophobin [Hypoxylon rubiginosum]